MALLPIERAAAGLGGWEVAHTWLAAAADGDISAGPKPRCSSAHPLWPSRSTPPPTSRRSAHLPGGHGNFGMAHGISGPLALLSLAMRRGIVVDGQAEAIERICSWLDAWRQDHETGPWWPETITFEETRLGRPKQNRPMRPSCVYGTPGLGRAQQLVELLLTPEPPGTAIGLLEGSTGLALALSTAAAEAPPAALWDTCLLLT